MLLNIDSTQTAGLLDQVRKGDRSAINVLLALNRSYLRRVIELRMDERLRGRLDASDVVQETQLAAAQRLDEYLRSPAISFRLWLRQTAIERLIDLRRRHLAEKRTPEREVPLPEHSSVALARQLLEDRPSQRLEREELAQQVRQAITKMSENDREILLLRHYEGLANHEVAELLGIEPATASQRYGRALRRFREALIESGISKP